MAGNHAPGEKRGLAEGYVDLSKKLHLGAFGVALLVAVVAPAIVVASTVAVVAGASAAGHEVAHDWIRENKKQKH